MLEGKTRIPPVDVETLPDDLRETLEEQRKLRDAPLYPYLFYARNPAYFRAAKGMWAALQQNAAVGSRNGISTEKIEALDGYAQSRLFDDAAKVALEYADAMTDTRAMIIARENASSRFNRAFRIPSHGFWQP